MKQSFLCWYRHRVVLLLVNQPEHAHTTSIYDVVLCSRHFHPPQRGMVGAVAIHHEAGAGRTRPAQGRNQQPHRGERLRCCSAGPECPLLVEGSGSGVEPARKAVFLASIPAIGSVFSAEKQEEYKRRAVSDEWLTARVASHISMPLHNPPTMLEERRETSNTVADLPPPPPPPPPYHSRIRASAASGRTRC